MLLGLLVGGLGYLAWQNGTFDNLDLDRTQGFAYLALVPSVILHEVSHGWVALGFGDDTAKRAGRLTLNPIAHIDPFWTVLLPGLLLLSGAPVIGMAKPVPVSPGRMRDPRNHGMVTALAGPAVNVVLAVLSGLVLRLAVHSGSEESALVDAVFALGLVNVFLAVFNMIPLPPLDGSSLVERLLPAPLVVPYLRFRQWSFLLLIGLFLVADNVFGRIVDPFVRLWLSLVT